MKPASHSLRIGVIGTGRIADVYFRNLANLDGLTLAACGSLDRAASQAKAAHHGIPSVLAPDAILTDPDIDVILNLTIPRAHAPITLAALASGKHVYSEKPFVTDPADGHRILALADQKDLMVGTAPDTFLGGRWQTARQMIDQGRIGTPIGAAAFVPTHGVERHHPNPDFYYARGGGPLLDLGPYYLAVLVFLLGPIERVMGMTHRPQSVRTIENGPRHGETLPVEVDTHCLGLLAFASGAIGHLMTSFDVWDSETPRLEIYGTDGTLCIPDPDPCDGANIFHGPVWTRTRAQSRWTTRPRPNAPANWSVAANPFGLNFDARGAGVADLTDAIRTCRPPRASARFGLHLAEVMAGLDTSARLGNSITITSDCPRPAPLRPTAIAGMNIDYGLPR